MPRPRGEDCNLRRDKLATGYVTWPAMSTSFLRGAATLLPLAFLSGHPERIRAFLRPGVRLFPTAACGLQAILVLMVLQQRQITPPCRAARVTLPFRMNSGAKWRPAFWSRSSSQPPVPQLVRAYPICFCVRDVPRQIQSNIADP